MNTNMDMVIALLLFVSSAFTPASGMWQHPDILDYEIHPCKRDCLSSPTSMRCEYNFTIEHYQTLSRACFDCPHNISDCYRPHCVTGDGLLRAIKVVNRMLPGPGIHVCKGDTVVVNVYNQLMDFEGTSIHWHGITQKGTPHMDGVAMVTQCPIPVHSVFQYKFKVDNAGTHFWHAHTGMQRGDGVHGALIVRDTRQTSAIWYDEDMPEHTVIVQDWLDQYTASKFSLHHHGMADNTPSSILINGRATAFGKDVITDVHGGHNMGSMGNMGTTTESTHGMGHMMDNDTTTHMTSDPDHMEGMMGDHVTTTERMQGDMGHDMEMNSEDGEEDDQVYVPHSIFRVQKGLRYRFRFINNGILNCPLKISVEKHNLTVIASDGYDVQPVNVESINLFAGERFDVVLSANQHIGNYWMHVVGQGDCARSMTSQTAIVRYHGAMEMKPSTGSSYHDGDRNGVNGNPVVFKEDSVTVAQMTSYESPDDVYSAHDVRKFYMLLGYNEVGNYRYLDPQYYPLDVMYELHKGMHANHLYALQINRLTYASPDMPVLTQYGEIDENIFCNESSIPRDCSREFCECVHRIKVGLDDVVELVLIGDGKYGMGNHPMHLHGHSFYVLGMEKLNETVDRSFIEELDARGRLKRNLVNPVKKDTVVVPDGGYTIIRFKANNPGFWLFHCHVDFHLHLGLNMVIQVGELHEMTSTPANFPRCGSWSYTGESTGESNGCGVSSASRCIANFQHTRTFIYAVVLCLCLLIS